MKENTEHIEKSIIEVNNLTKVFDGNKIAVNSISFTVKKNSVFGLLGPNGSGKTTTLRMLTTILHPTSGEIKIGALAQGDAKQKIRNEIGYVPQQNALYSSLTLWENVELFFAAYTYDGDRKARIEQVLKRVDLLGEKDTLAGNLSGGMAKRLSVACAIAHKPKIIFCDEVTMGLDPNSRYAIWDLIRELKKTSTVVLTTHYMDEAQKLCDELIILREGAIIATGSPNSILKQFKATNLDEVFEEISR